MMRGDLPPAVLERRAVVYVRQSTGMQVQENLESQRRQYELADLARSQGFRDVVTIDDDLGRSASGTTVRPGFESLVAQLCAGVVGAVFCLEASRLARNGREWHYLLELCCLVGARVIDSEGIYDPSHANDRLLLGLKGTMSEFELTLIRQRLVDGAVAKARRGELRIGVPVGYIWSRDTGLEMDPDRRVQEAIRTIFGWFDQLGSAHKAMVAMREQGLLVPRWSDPKRVSPLHWSCPSYRNVISVLTNPFYAGAYAYGKSSHRTKLVDGRMSRTYGHDRPLKEWTVLLPNHHDGYVSWEQFEKNQMQLTRNAFGKRAGGAKSGRGGRALLSGILRCGRCGRMLQVLYSGRGQGVARYHCRRGHGQFGLKPCIYFSAHRPDDAVAQEVFAVVQPLALEAVVMAEEQARRSLQERRRAIDLEREQAAYEARLAQRRYESIDPDNRLVASELEARWNAALARVSECEARVATFNAEAPPAPDKAQLLSIAEDLQTAWTGPSTTMAVKQRLVRTLIREIVVDVDDDRREVVLLIHWHGGQHSEVRVRKPGTGEHNKRASVEAAEVIRDMATKWDDERIAATLNRMGLRTGQGLTWNAARVGAYRRTSGIAAYESAVKDGRCLTMYEAARSVGVTSHAIRRLIKLGILPARQVVMDAPWQIMADDLELPKVQEALRSRRAPGPPVSQFR